MRDVYHYDQIDASTDVYGVVADPVGHSLSPLIHNAAFQAMGLNKVYVPLRVPREDLTEFVENAPRLGIKGLSVTIPHKETVIEVAHPGRRGRPRHRRGQYGDLRRRRSVPATTPTTARRCKAFRWLAAGPTKPKRRSRARLALVLGAGGVGKAIAYGLVRRGAKVVLSDGDSRRAVELAERLRMPRRRVVGPPRLDPDMIFNCTPIGMHPNVDETPFSKHHLRPNTIVFDAVYNPENTLLVKEARQRACKVITGVDMFVRQALLQFKLFTGLDGPADLMRDVLKRATAAVKY